MVDFFDEFSQNVKFFQRLTDKDKYLSLSTIRFSWVSNKLFESVFESRKARSVYSNERIFEQLLIVVCQNSFKTTNLRIHETCNHIYIVYQSTFLIFICPSLLFLLLKIEVYDYIISTIFTKHSEVIDILLYV